MAGGRLSRPPRRFKNDQITVRISMNTGTRIFCKTALTFLLAAIIGFLVYTSIDPRWGGGFWDRFVATHSRLSIPTISALVYWFRKSMHFLGYGTLSLLTWYYFYLWGFQRSYWPGIILAVLIASLDEYLQSRVPFRSGKPEDVLLDICGIVIVTSLTKLFLCRFRLANRD